MRAICSDYQQCVCPSRSVRQGRNRPTQTTPWPSLNTFEASCSLARLAKQRGGWRAVPESYPRDVFPDPGGPQISVIWPLWMPPGVPGSSSSPKVSHDKASSRTFRPVETGFDELVSSSCKTCAAERDGNPCCTVSMMQALKGGRRHVVGSLYASRKRPRETRYLPVEGTPKLATSCP